MKPLRFLICVGFFPIFITTLYLICPRPALGQASSFHVDDDNTTGTEDGTAQFPYNTIQEAINAAGTSGDTVRVAAGTYAGNVSVQGKSVLIYGGYVGGTATNYTNAEGGNFSGRDLAANSTEILGDGTDAAVTLFDADQSVLDGFRISGGTGNADALPFFYAGGGVYVDGGSPTVSNNIIEGNDTRHGVETPGFESNGGGIAASESNISVIDNIIRDNFSGFGAGISISGGSVIIRGNTVQGNIAINDHGGGMWISAPTVEISENLIVGNEIGRDLGFGHGGGVIVFGVGTSATLSFNIVRDNYAPSSSAGEFVDEGAQAILDHELIYNNLCDPNAADGGFGIYVDGGEDTSGQYVGSSATITHCTVVNNGCGGGAVGNGLLVDSLCEVTVTNTIFWGNGGDDFSVASSATLTMTYSNSEETLQGIGNLSVDPLFADTSNNDFHLRSTGGRWDPSANGGLGGFVVDADHSPCIDAGDPASDRSNEIAPNGDRVNMGVYGNTAEASKSSGPVSVQGDRSQRPRQFKLHQSFPNPFNPATVIRYELPRREQVRMSVYDVQGQRVRTLVAGDQDAGYYTVLWDGQDWKGRSVASGVYFYEIQAGEFVRVRKMILLK